MRSSSVRAVTLLFTGLALASTAGLAGCGSRDKPEPKQLERQNPFDRGVERREQDPNDPLRNPAFETPRGRDGEQLPAAEIDATLAEAAKFAEVGNVAQQRNVLRKCANKTPASARCDGEMGLSMIDAQNRRATALYYLTEAAQLDDPKADAALYMQIGEALRRFGRSEVAIAAMEKGIAREPSAEHLFALGQVLSLVPDRVAEGADRIAEARTKEDRIEWLYEEAVLRGQIPVREQAEQALALFEDYVTRAAELPPESLPAPPKSLAGRMTELDALRKSYPTAAEYEKTREAVKQAPAGEAEPEPEPGSKPADHEPT